MQKKLLLMSLAVGAMVLGTASFAQAHEGKGLAIGWGNKKDGKHLEHKAELLGMSAEELKKELESGKKLKEIIEEKGITKDEMKQRHEELRKKHLDELVANGKLTKEEAERRLKEGPRPGKRHGQMHRGQKMHNE